MNKNCLSWWFPLIRDAGLPVPKTEIVRLPDGAHHDLSRPLDGEPFGPQAEPFLAELRGSVERIGLPAFLRTGQGSGKHNWRHTCYLTAVALLERHVMALVEWSIMIGLPWNVWCVREMLPTRTLLTLPAYGDMPLCREFRCFVRDGEVTCVHPYWPRQSIVEGFFPRLNMEYDLPADFDLAISALDDAAPPNVLDLAHRAGMAVGGAWSVDILETRRGWYVTDMAEAERSFHWEGCEHAESFQKEHAW